MRISGIVLRNRDKVNGLTIVLEKGLIGLFDEPRERGVLVFSPIECKPIKAFRDVKELKEWFKNNKVEIEDLIMKHGYLDVFVIQNIYVIRKEDAEW